MRQPHHIRAILFLAVAGALAAWASAVFLAQREPEPIVPSDGLTRTGRLSDYFDGIRGGSGDSEVFFFDGDEPGATMLVLGATHGNESAGFITAVVLTENARVRKGRLIVIPRANASGLTVTDPLEGTPTTFGIPTAWGERRFRFGSRGTNPLDQWPDPVVYLHHPSGQQLSGHEARNLNRAYPGRPDGSYMERIAFAIMELIRNEHVDIAVDLHEAAPEIPIINAVVVHEKGKDMGANAVLDLEFEGLQYSLEISPPNFRGLSHREWGDASDVYPFLMETSNPIQGRLRGPTTEALIVDGIDQRYAEAEALGRMRITYRADGGEPLKRRVGRHLQGLHAIMSAYAFDIPDNAIEVDGIPGYTDLMEHGVGAYLNQPQSSTQ